MENGRKAPQAASLWGTDRKIQIARDLLAIGAVFLRPGEPFIWASGIKSPIYCDNRLTLSVPQVRRQVETAIAQVIRESYPACQILMGTSTAGIAHAAIAAWLLDKPMGYVRSGAKDHGRQNRIEGKLAPGEKAVIVEDLISTAGSALATAAALKEAGAEVLGIVSIFTYGLAQAEERLAQARLKNVSLSDFDTLVEVAAQEGYISRADVDRLLAFRKNPADESWLRL